MRRAASCMWSQSRTSAPDPQKEKALSLALPQASQSSCFRNPGPVKGKKTDNAYANSVIHGIGMAKIFRHGFMHAIRRDGMPRSVLCQGLRPRVAIYSCAGRENQMCLRCVLSAKFNNIQRGHNIGNKILTRVTQGKGN